MGIGKLTKKTLTMNKKTYRVGLTEKQLVFIDIEAESEAEARTLIDSIVEAQEKTGATLPTFTEPYYFEGFEFSFIEKIEPSEARNSMEEINEMLKEAEDVNEN